MIVTAQSREKKMTRESIQVSEFSENRQERDRFERLITSHRQRAYSMALQLTRNTVDAEDLMQDTMVKAWRGYGTYLTDRPFLNWLLRIMQRAYLDNRRRENPIRRADSLQGMVSPLDGEVQELSIPDDNALPDEELFRTAFQAELRRALYDLPDVYRVAIELCDLEGMSYNEIADACNTTVGTIRSRIHRGRKLLREIVKKRGIELPGLY